MRWWTDARFTRVDWLPTDRKPGDGGMTADVNRTHAAINEIRVMLLVVIGLLLIVLVTLATWLR